MGKLYALDDKLLTGCPEIRIGDKVYSVDDRKNTVKKMTKLIDGDKAMSVDTIDEALRLAFGDKNFKEIENLNLSFSAYQKLFEIVISAMMGTEPDEARFQQSK